MDTAPYVEVRVTQRYRAPAARVFDAWINPEVAGLWLFATASRPAANVRIDARVGGSFRFVERGSGMDIEHTGEYMEIARPRRLVFTLSKRRRSRGRSRVLVEIAPLDTGCELTLVHESVASDHAGRIEGRWAGVLYGLEGMLRQAVNRSSASLVDDPLRAAVATADDLAVLHVAGDHLEGK